MNPLGYNPLRWDCEKDGCYNKKLRPRIEEFADCFPGKIAMSDVDGVVEICRHFLFLEWKSDGGKLKTGQRILYERLTELSPLVTVIVVLGDPQTMDVQTVQVFHRGVSLGPDASDLLALKVRIMAWADRAVADGRMRS